MFLLKFQFVARDCSQMFVLGHSFSFNAINKQIRNDSCDAVCHVVISNSRCVNVTAVCHVMLSNIRCVNVPTVCRVIISNRWIVIVTTVCRVIISNCGLSMSQPFVVSSSATVGVSMSQSFVIPSLATAVVLTSQPFVVRVIVAVVWLSRVVRRVPDCYTSSCVPEFIGCAARSRTTGSFKLCKLEHRACAMHCWELAKDDSTMK